ncbi:MAG: helix-turn-helix transcriptional regulator [Bacteroidaceae bacterium]|nr:helix-turn-helix transcriptional regulator [Bacteroidaceae bacterium]
MHIGEIIRQKVKERGKSVVWLSRELSCSRTNVYKLYDKSSIDTDVLLRLSVILNCDFFAFYSQELGLRRQPPKT